MTPAGDQRLFLHVGLPKSGTSHLQRLLAESRPALRDAGFLYPFVRPEGMFHAAVELRGQGPLWGLAPELIDGTWQSILHRVRSVPEATAIVSHEILAGAAPAVVDRIARDTADLELHVVVTARDLARQAAAHWQEEVKNGRPWSFREFEQALSTSAESVQSELGFWRSQDLLDVLARWRRAVPAARLHLVTVPAESDAPDGLRQRFERAVGLPDGVLAAAEGTAGRVNASLGVAEVALLRRVVEALDGRLVPPAYSHVVKRWFAQDRLASRGGRRPEVPAPFRARLAEISAGWVEELREADVSVHGDLEDLVPAPAPAGPHPDDVPVEELWGLAPDLLADLLVEVARLREQEEAGPAGDAPTPASRVRRLPLRRRKA